MTRKVKKNCRKSAETRAGGRKNRRRKEEKKITRKKIRSLLVASKMWFSVLSYIILKQLKKKKKEKKCTCDVEYRRGSYCQKLYFVAFFTSLVFINNECRP